MQKILIIINDAPYGTEKAYNALRIAMTSQKEHGDKVEIKIFLLADAVFCGLSNQRGSLYDLRKIAFNAAFSLTVFTANSLLYLNSVAINHAISYISGYSIP